MVPQRSEHTHRFLRGSGVLTCCLRVAGEPHTCQPSSKIVSSPSFHVFGTVSETLWSRRLTWSSDHLCCWPWWRKYRDTVLRRPNRSHRPTSPYTESRDKVTFRDAVNRRGGVSGGEGISPKIDKMAAPKRSLSRNLTAMKVLLNFSPLNV